MHSIQTTIDGSMDEAEAATRTALGAVGFGVVSEIDVAANLRNALGTERAPLKILGACSPVFAQKALEVDSSVALLMPCNVVLEPDGDRTRVTAIDPRELISDPAFAELAEEAADQLTAALAALGGVVSESTA